MIYLSDHSNSNRNRNRNSNDGHLIIKDHTNHTNHIIEPKEGRLVIFNQDLLHLAEKTTTYKYFIRTEIMCKRKFPIETEQDQRAIHFFNMATAHFYIDPQLSLEYEQKAFELSKTLQEMIE